MDLQHNRGLNWLWAFAVAVAIGGGAVQRPAWAQEVRPPGAIDMGPSMGATTDAAIGSLRTKILARTQEGRRRIASGRADTGFTPSTEGRRLAVKSISFTDPEDPKTLPEQIRYLQRQVAEFNRRIAAHQLRPNDLADGYTMAHALLYEAYYDRKLSLKELQDNREELRRVVLSDENYQGMTDAERQEIYDRYAATAIYGIECREQARGAADRTQRESLIQRAQRNAKSSGLLKLK